MKKFVAMILALTMLLTLVACGGNNSSNNSSTSTPSTSAPSTSTPSTTPPPGEPAPVTPSELKNTDIYPLEGDHKLSVGIQSSIENPNESIYFQMFQEAIGIDIEYQSVTNEQAHLLYAGDAAPDVLFGQFGLSAKQMNGFGEAGALINFMDHLDKMPNLSRVYAENPRMFACVQNYEGAVYTLPQVVYTLTSAGNMLYARTDYMAAVGWEKDPATIEEFTQYLRDLRDYYLPKDPQFIPFTPYSASHMKYGAQISQALFPAFGELSETGLTTSPDGKTVVAGFTTEQYKLYVTWMNSLYEEGLLDPNAFTADSTTMKAFMNEGHTGVNSIMSLMKAEHFPSGNLDLTVLAPMSSQYDSTATYIKPSLYKAYNVAISTSCKDLDAALAYVDAFYSTEEYPLNEEGTIWGISFWLGKLGEGWDIREEGVSYNNMSGSTTGLNYSTAPFIGNFDLIPYVDDVAGFKAVCVKEKLLPVAIDHVYTNELALTEDETDTYTDAWADIDPYVAQMHAAFITGEADINAEWDNFIKQLDALGLQDVLDAYQAALDRYNAALS